MAIETLYETQGYRYCRDTLYGTSWFERKKDDHVSLLQTGSDSVEEVEWVQGLSDELDRSVFNSIANEQTYSPRWSKEYV